MGPDLSLIGELCEHLEPLLRAEIAAGNRPVEANRGWPTPESVVVMLERGFLVDPGLEGARTHAGCVEYTEVNDPHWWKAEYRCLVHQHLLACRFT